MMVLRKFFLILVCFLFLLSCGQNTKNVKNENTQADSIPQERRIFALGDSLTAGYGLELEDAYPAQLESKLTAAWYRYKVVNAGVSGNTSAELLARIEWTLTDANPEDIVILVIGGNDGLRGLPISDLKKNILSMIEIIQAKELTLVLAGMQIPPNLGLAYARDFKNVYSEIVAEVSDIYFLEFFLEDVAAVRKYNLPDMIHPNREGYQVIVENVFEFLVDNTIVW